MLLSSDIGNDPVAPVPVVDVLPPPPDPMAPSLLRSTPKRVSAPGSVVVSYFCSPVNSPASLRVQPYWP